MSDDRVVFPTNDPFASASAEPEPAPEPTPEPSQVAEEVVTPEVQTAEPGVPVETPSEDTEPEPSVKEVAPVIAPELSEAEISERARVRQLEIEHTAAVEQQNRAVLAQRQRENAHLAWINHVSNDKEFEVAEIDRLGLTGYMRSLSLGDTIMLRRENEAREASQQTQIQSQEQIRAEIKLEHERKVATETAYAYGKSLGLKEDRIAAIFQENNGWAHQPDLKRAAKDARNALFFAAHTQGIPEAAQTVVSAEEIARGKVAQISPRGGAPRQKVTDPDEQWANDMAAAINGPGGTVFQ